VVLITINKFVYYSLFLCMGTIVLSQNISSDFIPSQYIEILHDYGTNWKTNSSFKPYRWDNFDGLITSDSNQFLMQWVFDDLKSLEILKITSSKNAEDKFKCNTWFGTLLQYSDGEGAKFQDGTTTLYGYFHFSYKNHYKGWLYPRITTDQYSLPHYTGKPRPNRRAGFNTGETDMAGIGYFSEWMKVWFGRGRQNWGAMAVDNLALSEKSAAYDHGTLQLKFNNVRLRYFHGYLETLEDNHHRYITGRGLEYNNQRNLVIGAHEITIYSGEDRPMDIAYFNPIATHLEVELNERDNRSGGTGEQNAVWQLSTDWMPLKGLRVSSNFLFDEFALDDVEKDSLGRNTYAFQGRIAYTRSVFKFLTTLDFKYTNISTNTFRHEQGGNNFVSRNLPLGSDLGSDGDRWYFGIRTVTPFRILTNLQVGQKRSGINNLLNNLYEPSGEIEAFSFPSGNIEVTKFIKWDLTWSIKNNIYLKVRAQKADSNIIGNQDYIIFSLDVFWPTYF